MSNSVPKTGVLPINIGTPEKPQIPEVRRYLREFLSDPLVVDINPVMRWLLLNFVVLPRRPKQSAAAYRAIWSSKGSPLLVNSLAMGAGLQEALGEAYVVVPAMRYGNPSIAQAIEHMAELGVEHLVVFPLYPQYAQSSTETSILESKRIAARVLPSATVDVVPPFFDDEEVIKAYAAQGRKILDEFQPDHVLFSFHGLPERHIFKSDNSRQHCLKSEHCCAQMVAANSRCYRAQSFQSARLIAAELSLAQSQWSTSFQSRLGRSKWIEPYTDVLLDELPKRGIKRTAVFCPAFVSDCLETLEEIGIRAKAQFIEAGGEDLRLVPSLNASPQWVNAAANLVRQSAGSAQ